MKLAGEVKVKLPLCVIRYHATNTFGALEIMFHISSVSKHNLSTTCRLLVQERRYRIRWIASWVDNSTSVDAMAIGTFICLCLIRQHFGKWLEEWELKIKIDISLQYQIVSQPTKKSSVLWTTFQHPLLKCNHCRYYIINSRARYDGSFTTGNINYSEMELCLAARCPYTASHIVLPRCSKWKLSHWWRISTIIGMVAVYSVDFKPYCWVERLQATERMAKTHLKDRLR
jgi:hypothetical protein